MPLLAAVRLETSLAQTLFFGVDQHREILVKLNVFGYDREDDLRGLRFH
jgi:hypothetical protein